MWSQKTPPIQMRINLTFGWSEMWWSDHLKSRWSSNYMIFKWAQTRNGTLGISITLWTNLKDLLSPYWQSSIQAVLGYPIHPSIQSDIYVWLFQAALNLKCIIGNPKRSMNWFGTTWIVLLSQLPTDPWWWIFHEDSQLGVGSNTEYRKQNYRNIRNCKWWMKKQHRVHQNTTWKQEHSKQNIHSNIEYRQQNYRNIRGTETESTETLIHKSAHGQ